MSGSDSSQTLEFRIESPSPEDAQALADFNIEMAEETEGRRLDPTTVFRGVQAIFENPERGRYLIARHKHRVIGQLLITREWSDWRNGDIWWIQSVFVSPGYRRKGVFRSLFDRVHIDAKDRDDVVGIRLYVETENDIAKTTYQKLGMSSGGYEVMELMKKS